MRQISRAFGKCARVSTKIPDRMPDQLEGIALPEQSPQLIGHDTVADAILGQAREGRLPGAILLHGPKGIGKATLAFSLTKQILTLTGDEPVERVNEQVNAGVHPNVFTLRRKPRDTGNGFYTAIRVEDVRNVQQRMRQTRGRAGHRICIIDPIDECNANSANALLKILEEPPADTVFLAISHRPGALLPTIRSRCHAHALRALNNADVTTVLMQQMPELAATEIERVIQLAQGRPQRAFEALLLDNLEALEQLQNWLANPGTKQVADHLKLAESITKSGGAEEELARELIVDWMAQEARTAALNGAAGRNRLASATKLWEKAQALFADADAYNLDAKQTLVSIFDALRLHVSSHADLAPAG